MTLVDAYRWFGPLRGDHDDAIRQEAATTLLAALERLARGLNASEEYRAEAPGIVYVKLLQLRMAGPDPNPPATDSATSVLLRTMLSNAARSMWRKLGRLGPMPEGDLSDPRDLDSDLELLLDAGVVGWVEAQVTAASEVIAARIRAGDTFLTTVKALQQIARGELSSEAWKGRECGDVDPRCHARLRQRVSAAHKRLAVWLNSQSACLEPARLVFLTNYVNYIFDPGTRREQPVERSHAS